jgi:ComF family protein
VLRNFSAAAFSLVFPEECQVCGIHLKNLSRIPVCPGCLSAPEPFVAEYFCRECRTPFLNAAPLDSNGRCALCRRGMVPFDGAYAYGEYDGELRKLIHLFKYTGVTTLAKPLGAMLTRALPRDEQFDVIVPMPLHWLRRWRRGFNQSELLAGVVGRRSGIAVSDAMTRRRSTNPQAGLTGAQRRLNVSGAFAVRKRPHIEGRRVLLVDDVFTTGATAAAAAAALRRAGATRVSVLALARVDRRKGPSGRSIS